MFRNGFDSHVSIFGSVWSLIRRALMVLLGKIFVIQRTPTQKHVPANTPARYGCIRFSMTSGYFVFGNSQCGVNASYLEALIRAVSALSIEMRKRTQKQLAQQHR